MPGLAASSQFIGDGVWVDGSIFTNPADQQVLVDTGPLLRGNYLVAVIGTGSVPWVYDIQQRDAANAANIHSQRRRPPAGNDDVLFSNKISLNSNERVRVILQGAIAGEIQMSIFYIEVG